MISVQSQCSHVTPSLMASQDSSDAAHLCKEPRPRNHGEAAILYLFHFAVFKSSDVLAQA